MRHFYTSALTAALLFVLPAVALGASPLVELRVEGPSETLDSGTWYVTGTERIRKSKPSDACKRTKGRIRVPGPNALGLVQTGARVDPNLNQVRIRKDEAGLFVCEIGSVLGRSFTDPGGFAGWSYYQDWVFGSAAADQARVANNDQILWVFSDFGTATPANTGSVLELRKVPARTDGQFQVKVVEHGFDGSTVPAAGATIEGADAVTESGNGLYEVTVGRGKTTLRATRGLDIPSNQVEVCSKPKLAKCPKAHGRTIVGSANRDVLAGTRGFDNISAGAGNDVVNLRSGGRDKVSCGPGRDIVRLRRGDRDDRIASNCETIRRG